MGEILAVVTGALALLEQSLKLFAYTRDALNKPKNLRKLLDRYPNEVSNVKRLLDLVEKETALQTEAVKLAAVEIRDASSNLCNSLEKVKERLDGGKLDQVISFFTQSDTKGEVQDRMDELTNAKLYFISTVQLVIVGITKGTDNSIKINTTTLQRLDKLLHERLGNIESFKIKKIIDGRTADANGLVTLTKEDIKELTGDTPESVAAKSSNSDEVNQGRVKKVVENNLALNNAFLQLVPVGEIDAWKDVDVYIRGNVSKDNATMLAHPVPEGYALELARLHFQTRR
ncbi:hypothetical protein F5Y01DRAFT_273506 [Xylaria sp. FL0043]|nr:hypothetical protein F5Y01DRAFT_273506 [Xylaria sp. FL0043]